MDKVSSSAIDFFGAVEDARQRGKVVHPLDEILLVVLAGTLAGADNFVEMAAWARANPGALRRFRPFARGVPSHDTPNDVVNRLDPGTFEECFLDRVAAIRPDAPDPIAVDGKTSRRTGDARSGRRPRHTLSACARAGGLVLAQEAPDGKSDERAMIPSPLDKLRLRGSPVTVDAAGCHRPVAERALEAGGDHLLAAEANRPELLAGIRAALAGAPPEAVDRCEAEGTAHGRAERRRCAVVAAPPGLGGKAPRPGARVVAAVEGTAVRGGKALGVTRHYVCSRAMAAAGPLAAVRAHREVESAVHRVLDVVFGDDGSRLRSGYGRRDMALVRRIALDLLRRRPPGKDSLTVRRKPAGWSVAYLIETIAGPQP
jgi:predicted transposase YbfD/YdcC